MPMTCCEEIVIRFLNATPGAPSVLAPSVLSPSDIASMEALARALQRDPSSEPTRALLRDAGVTHLYLGVQGGPIDERKLESSPYYRAVYRREGVAIFELTERSRNSAALRVERGGDWAG